MSENPYFTGQEPAIFRINHRLYDGYLYNHSIYGKVVEIYLYSDFDDFCRDYFKNNRSYMELDIREVINKDVFTWKSFIVDLLSYNSDSLKFIFIIH